MNHILPVAPDARQLSDLEATIVTLEQAQAQATSAVVESVPARLPINAVLRLDHGFNGRDDRLDEQHLGQLVRSVRSLPDLAPVLVLRIGNRFALVDGYHRLAAYDSAERLDIPVEVFAGTVREAVLEAACRNTRAALQMDSRARHDCAWRLVNAGFMHDEVSKASGVSVPQVTIMRKAKRLLGDDAAAFADWWSARRAAKGALNDILGPEEVEAMLELQVQAYADRLRKGFGNKLALNPGLAARALALHFGRTLGDLVGYLRGHLSKVELDRMDNPEF